MNTMTTKIMDALTGAYQCEAAPCAGNVLASWTISTTCYDKGVAAERLDKMREVLDAVGPVTWREWNDCGVTMFTGSFEY